MMDRDEIKLYITRHYIRTREKYSFRSNPATADETNKNK